MQSAKMIKLINKAQDIANKERINMVIYYDKYAEHKYDEYGYMPEASLSIFKYHEVIKTIKPVTSQV